MDPIADMLTQIRNAAAVSKTEVLMPHSKLKENLAKLLQSQKWIEGTEILEQEGKKKLKIALKYNEQGQAVISGVARVSKPGQRIYVRAHDISRQGRGIGMTVISTSRGLMFDKDARKVKLGGEVICQIW